MSGKAELHYLITDDDADDRDFIEEALAKQGIKDRIKTFENGSMLLDYLKKHPDTNNIVLLDLNMPVMNGYDALREIKTANTLKHTNVIILTSSVSEEDKQRCTKLGADGFFRKPLTLQGYEDLGKEIVRGLL